MTEFRTRMKIDRWRRSSMKLCETGRLTDEKQAWLIGTRAAGEDTLVQFVDFDNADYDSTILLDEIRNKGFVGGGKAMTVDRDFNMYFISGEDGHLFKYDFEEKAFSYRVNITSDVKSIAYIRHLGQLAVIFGGGTLRIYDPADGSFISSHGSFHVGNPITLRYSYVTRNLYWVVEESNEQVTIVEIDTSDFTSTLYTDLIPAGSVNTSNPAEGSYTIDYEGNHYFVHFPESGNCAVIKYDSGLNFVWEHQNAVGGSVNIRRVLAVGLDDTVYLSHENSDGSHVREIVTDDDGLNPSNGWITLVSGSQTDSPAIWRMQVERSFSGRIFAGVDVAGGLYMIDRDGNNEGTVTGGNCREVVLLPGETHALPA